MAYVPGFENDVFISFGHIDNEAPSKNWVTELHAFIQGRLKTSATRTSRSGAIPGWTGRIVSRRR